MLRDKLHCKSFDWYMQNIYPEKFIPTKNVKHYGRVEALSRNICLDDMQQNLDEPYNLGGYLCYKTEVTSSQLFSFTKNNVLRTERNCATVQEG
jgi:polypeptide N-acetylgalactosaminyltransferase